MDRLANAGNTIDVIKRHGFTFQKRFGQNFLVDTHVLEKIMDAADITDEDHSYVTFLDKWELDVGGIIDDCIEDTLDWYKEEGIAV